MLPAQDSSKMPNLENAPILKKNIIGKADVDIAALIMKLGNSDWVQQGRQYFVQLDDQCPFCQQKTDAAFRHSLEDYFDQSYIDDLAAVEKLHSDYTQAVNELFSAYGAADILDSPYLSVKLMRRTLPPFASRWKAMLSTSRRREKSQARQSGSAATRPTSPASTRP